MAQSEVSSYDSMRFDVGEEVFVAERGAVELKLEDLYSPDAGFGWTCAPRQYFSREELSRSRDTLTIDGAMAPRIEFQADVSPGDWLVTIWVDAGTEPESTLRVNIQKKPQTLGWYAFKRSSEPRKSLLNTYRVLQVMAKVRSEGISIELVGGEDEVRLLGFSLIRRTEPSTAGHRHLLNQLEEHGRFDNRDSISKLVTRIEESLPAESEDPFYAFWLERIKLLELADRYFSMRGWEWAKEESGLGMFDRLFQVVMLTDGLLCSAKETNDPLLGRAKYLRGRVLFWLSEQMWKSQNNDVALKDLKELYASHPEDKLLAMYAGKKVADSGYCDDLQLSSRPPAWSIRQREALCRMRHIAHWWVKERQAPNGEFGGKLGDDVELLRWWAPLVLSGDQTSQTGWQKLADGVWNSKYIHDGYARDVADVEHAAEFIADSACLISVFRDDPQYLDRLARSREHFENLWTGSTIKGHRFFRSAWFSSKEIATDEPKNRDLEYNSRATKAIRYLTLQRRDATTIRLLHEWSQAWVSAALRTDKGKPKGIIPASVRFSDEAFNGDEPTWYRANMHWHYFEWEHHAGSLILDQLLYTYCLTKDEALLRPMLLTLELIREEEKNISSDHSNAAPAGSRTWVAKQLIPNRLFWSVVEQWRFLTGDRRWDDLILRYGTHYGRFRLTKNEAYLEKGLEELLEGVRYNIPLKTTEALHTDRVYAPGYELLSAMLTGDGTRENLSPYFAVTWEKTSRDFTALVRDSGPTGLAAQLFVHSPEKQQVVMRLWQLSPGEYQLRVEAHEQELERTTILLSEKGQRILLDLPGDRLVTVLLESLH